ncbi:hypothetical protein Tco_0903735 [Tanacetum coccineum]
MITTIMHQNLTKTRPHPPDIHHQPVLIHPPITKGKEVSKPRTPPPLSTSKEDNDPEQAQRDKDMQKSITLIAKQFGNQKTVTVAGARETVEEKGVPLSAEQSDWLQDIHEELDEKKLEAHYMYMAKIQEVLHVIDDNSGPTDDIEPLEQIPIDNEYKLFAKDRQHSEQPKFINDTYVIEMVDSNVIPDHSDMCNNEFKDDQNADDNDENERVELANLLANLKLGIVENKKIKSN